MSNRTYFEIEGKKYQRGQRVRGTVLRVLPFGVLVELSDGKKGVIRRRELSWNLEISDQAMNKIAPEDRNIEPIVIGVDKEYQRLNLSLRQAEFDPWEALSESDEYGVGSIVKGSVVSLQPYGAFVELEEPRGVVGLLHISEIPHGSQKEITDLLWVGDSVEVMIKDMNPRAHSVGLSIIRRLEAQVDQNTQSKSATLSVKPAPQNIDLFSNKTHKRDHESTFVIHKTGVIHKVLVVEDNRDFAKFFVEQLESLGYVVDIVFTGERAIELGSVIKYDLVFCDMHLPDMQGTEVARGILSARSRTKIAIVTGDDGVGLDADFDNLDLTRVFLKPIDWDEIAQFLQDLEFGNASQPKNSHDQTGEKQEQFLQRILASVNVNEALKTKLNAALRSLYDLTEAEASFIFKFDPILRQVSVLAGSSTLPLYEVGLADLHHSPVNDVAHRGEWIFENHVTKNAEARFSYLSRFIYFESCLALPIEADNDAMEYALFLFHSEPHHFTETHRQYIMLSAKAIELALEKAQMEAWIQKQHRLLLAGQLGLSLTHEVNNKLTSIGQYAKNLELDYQDLNQTPTYCEDKAFLSGMEKRISRIIDIVNNFSKKNIDYMGLLRDEQYAAVDINHLLQDVGDLVDPLTRRRSVHLEYSLDADLPLITSNALRLEHVFLNLMLNAVQNMREAFVQDRKLELRITTSYIPHQAQLPIQIRVTDRGPGIHRQQFDWVFNMGTGTREDGSGLGLFISRGLIESMGGRLTIEKSQMFVGTTFLVELPFVSGEEAA